ncbi:MAG: hypothetical protein AAGF11_47070 [Myxococcota bacterium]
MGPMVVDPAWVGPGLVALRWWALLQVQVIWARTVGPWWTVVAAGLAIVLATGVSGRAVMMESVDLGVAVVAELALGGMIGLVVALPGHALVGASQGSAEVLGVGPGPWRALTLSLVAATALGLDLHHPLLVAGQELWAVWPVGRPQVWLDPGAGAGPGMGTGSGSMLPIARLAHAMTLLALTLATPALLAAAVTELTIGLLGVGPVAVGPAARTLASWARVAAALVATGASWAAYDAAWAERALLEGMIVP